MFNRFSFLREEIGSRTLLDSFTSSRFYAWLNPKQRFKRIDELCDKLQKTGEAKLP